MLTVAADAPGAAAQAADALKKPGAVVLLPTETVYGLVCRANDAEAEERIFRLKARDHAKRLTWFVADWRTLPAYGVVLDGLPGELASRHMPGPLTLIAPVAGGGTQGFRIPAHDFCLRLLAELNFPLASTSANLSGEPAAHNIKDALAMLHGEVDLAVDGGLIPADSLPSTVADATGETVRILRQGALHL